MPWSPSIVGSGSGGKSPCEQRSSKQHHDPELHSTSRIEDIRLKLSSPSRDRDSFVSNSSSDRGGSVSPVGHDSDTPPDMPTSAPPQTTTKYVPLSERAGMLKNPNHTVVDDSHKDTASHMTTAKRDTRDAFFKNDVSAPPKFDPGQREREKDQEKEVRSRAAYTSHTHSSSKEVDGYVGFANLPNQVYRKSVKRGFEFTLMVVGESGLGKSTLVNSMFITDLYNADYMGPSHRIKKTVQVDTTQVLLKEGGVQLKLTVVDTPGFGDAVDNSNCWQPVINYVESKYEHYLNAESRVNRNITADERVHCCLYFIAPTGHGLKPLDIEFMKRLHDKVNIIPLIAKADTLTPDECREFKKTLLNEIARHKIKIYEFPDCDDEEENRHQKKLKDRVPFAVVGSNTVVEAGGRKVRGRIYPWGVVEVENLEHNDFIALRNMLIRTHMQDLKDITNNVHYENFRYSRLAFLSADDTHSKVIEKRARDLPIPMPRRKRLNHVISPLVALKAQDHAEPEKYRSTNDLYNALSGSSSFHGADWKQYDTDTVLSLERHKMSSQQERRKKAATMLAITNRNIVDPIGQMAEEKKDHVQKLKKMEAEMEQVFEMKVKEKMQKLKDSEVDLQRRMEQMKKSLEQQTKELDDRRRAFEKERDSWEDIHKQDEHNRETMDKKNKKKLLF